MPPYTVVYFVDQRQLDADGRVHMGTHDTPRLLSGKRACVYIHAHELHTHVAAHLPSYPLTLLALTGSALAHRQDLTRGLRDRRGSAAALPYVEGNNPYMILMFVERKMGVLIVCFSRLVGVCV